MTTSIATTRSGFCKHRLLEHLRHQAASYFKELDGSVAISLVDEKERRNSAIYRYRLTAGPCARGIIAKVPFVSRENTSTDIRSNDPQYPRLYPRANNETKGFWEFEALQHIRRHFSQFDDARFGTIRPLELLTDPYVLILAEQDDLNLRSLLGKSHRYARASTDILASAARHAGHWLRCFHALKPLGFTRPRTGSRHDFLNATEQLVTYLSNMIHDDSGRFRAIGEVMAALAARFLPQQFQMGLGHGDFAPRNILVDRNARITVFDTMARWTTPIYEDLGMFLQALNSNGVQVSTFGLWQSPAELQRCESSFLQGYFGSRPVPMARIRLFECLLTLERWSAIWFRASQQSLLRQQLRSRLWSRHLSQRVDYLLNTLQRGNDGVGSQNVECLNRGGAHV